MTGEPLEHDDTDDGVDGEAPAVTDRPPPNLDESEGAAEPLTDAVTEVAGDVLGDEPPETGESGADETGENRAVEAGDRTEHETSDAPESERPLDPEATVNLTGDFDTTVNLTGDEIPGQERDDASVASDVTRGHLKGLLEALIFASDKPIKANELAKAAAAPSKQVKEILEELKGDFASRGVQLDEVAGGWIFRTNAAYAPFVRDLTKQKPARLSRAQVETLAILAYRQPVTRPEIDEIRGVDCGPVLKVLLERDLVRMLGRKDEPGRPVIYGTTTQFLEFFGLKSLKDLPTLREFTDLNEESRRTVERELGETMEETMAALGVDGPRIPAASDTLPPNDEESPMNTEIPPPMDAAEMAETGADEGVPAEAAADTGETSDDASVDTPPETREEAADEPNEPAPEEAKKPDGELDPEEEFPDDDDDDFDDDDDDDDDDEGDEDEGEKEKEDEP